MAVVFNGYCYSTLGEALIAEVSLPPHLDAVGHAVAAFSYVGTGASSANITYKDQAGATITLARVYPSCSVVGSYSNPNFQLSQLDGNVIAAAFLGGFGFLFIPMATVWAAKHVLQMLR